MLAEKLREYGVVGAGGAGFPAHVKAQSRVEFVIANGAECEPLIHKDAELMKHYPAEILDGMSSMMAAVRRGVGQVRHKDQERRIACGVAGRLNGGRSSSSCSAIIYPSGDEYELVYSATGRLIPPAGIPLQRWLRGQQRRDALQRAARRAGPAGHAQVPLGLRRGAKSRRRFGRRWARRFAT